MHRRSILNDICIKGSGVFNNQSIDVVLCQSECGNGIRFIRSDIKQNNIINVKHNSIYSEDMFTTTISNGNCQVRCIEHILSALFSLNITDIDIYVNNDEIPLLDGSSLYWVKAIKTAGIQEYNNNIQYKYVNKEIKFENEDKYIIVKPCDYLKISYTIDFKDNLIGRNEFIFNNQQYSCIKEILPARTFCTNYQFDDYKKIKKYISKNEIIIFYKDHFESIDNKLRFNNEPARHKVLDLIGDLMSTGDFICGEFICYKSGHSMNRKIIEKIYS